MSLFGLLASKAPLRMSFNIKVHPNAIGDGRSTQTSLFWSDRWLHTGLRRKTLVGLWPVNLLNSARLIVFNELSSSSLQ